MGAQASAAAVLDTGPVVALLREEPRAGDVEELLRSRRSRLTAVNAAEVVDVFLRRHGGTPDEVIPKVDQLLASGVELMQASLDLAVRAGAIRARLFDRRTRRLSLADCFVLAAVESGDSVITTDATLAAAARDAGIDVVDLSG